MGVNIVTGRKGEMHITSDDERMRNAEIYGDGKFVFDCGASNRRFTIELVGSDPKLTVRVNSGMVMSYGTQMGIEPEDYEDLVFDQGALGVKRIDYIVMQYTRDKANDVEDAQLVIKKGTPDPTNPTPPTFTSGNILKGEILDETPLFKVIFDGTGAGIASVEPIYRLRDGMTPVNATDRDAETHYDPTIPVDPSSDPSTVVGGVITPADIDRIWGSGIEDADAVPL